MKRKHRKTLQRIYRHPASGNIAWDEIEALFKELGAEVSERAGSRVAVVLYAEVRVFHRPHLHLKQIKGPWPVFDNGCKHMRWICEYYGS